MKQLLLIVFFSILCGNIAMAQRYYIRKAIEKDMEKKHAADKQKGEDAVDETGDIDGEAGGRAGRCVRDETRDFRWIFQCISEEFIGIEKQHPFCFNREFFNGIISLKRIIIEWPVKYPGAKAFRNVTGIIL